MKEPARIRREKVSYYLIRNMNETKIAKTLGVSRQTIVRDVSFLKKLSQSWLDGLVRDGFIFEYKLALDRKKENGYLLRKMLDETKDVSERVTIIKARNENDKLYLEMLSETPTINAFRKAIRMAKTNNVSES